MRAVLLIVVVALLGMASAAKKNPKECEVCKKVVSRVVDTVKEQGKDVTDVDATEAALWKLCRETKNHKEGRFCYYVGAADDAATGLVREVTQPLSRFLPADAVCNKLKKKDSQICELEYDEPVDLSKIDLEKQRVKVLKKILSDQFNDACKGCLEKSDYIKRIRELSAKQEL
ncbi:uncharacterized protein MONBRDRAFT_20855 [Monosiga brevicollis MX1]|uniref:Mesencephalic astrocyte-derived neurotrophic factor homolog n=1 Tax=Monosiga brevicollis TaxID=81824 RepID=A9UY42_MONBE|nr:uncharacterized protein MONBRDRAFT_20855 [Monosiga brevicollis MX1]EDQ89795.1 predicted protein [Monosiga brevicollis MX1]|eukprot:XP_001745217.1 hypothetical protein [Monosiga brevicollis MX1]